MVAAVKSVGQGTLLAPDFYDGPSEVLGDVHLTQQFYTYATREGLVSGKTFSVMFTIERPSREVWPFFKDPNLWQNGYGHYYSTVVGEAYKSEEHDLGHEPWGIAAKPNDVAVAAYQTIRVVPGHAMVFFQPIPAPGKWPAEWFFGQGGVSPGFHIFSLHGHGGKTVATILMEHATRTQGKSVEEALAPWREMAQESHRKFRDVLIPTLKKLVDEAPR